LDGGEKAFPFDGQSAAVAGAVEELDGQFSFQGGDHLAHGRLGIPQHFRRFGQTTQFDRLLQGNISVHFHITFLHIYIPNIYFTYATFQYIL